MLQGHANITGVAEIISPVITLLDEDMPEALRFICTSAAKMYKLLMGLLHLSRSGRGGLSIDTLDMNVMRSQVVDSIEYQIKDTGVEVVVNDLPSCRGDGVSPIKFNFQVFR